MARSGVAESRRGSHELHAIVPPGADASPHFDASVARANRGCKLDSPGNGARRVELSIASIGKVYSKRLSKPPPPDGRGQQNGVDLVALSGRFPLDSVFYSY